MTRHNDARLRSLITETAARIILDEGLDDFGAAKRKAAERLGVAAGRNLPRNADIEQAVLERQRLFATERDRSRLVELRRAAVEAMRLLRGFEPRLVGSVLRGTAHTHSDVNLHLFTDAVEEVVFRLIEAGIPHHMAERRMRGWSGAHEARPAIRFVAGDIQIEAVVFPYDGLRQAPPSPVDGRPTPRASLRELESLLADSA
ncbi:MAG: hypothetical protein PVI15_01465 [Chromatiales bacterium]|jgi:hypothetical protein